MEERSQKQEGVETAIRLSESLPEVAVYMELLNRWSRRINLVGPGAKGEILVHHVQDSLMAVARIPVDAKRLIDVGSGAGFPGLIIAMARPDLEIVALEPVHKKHAFLCAAARELGLAGFDARARRMEEHLEENGFRPYDVAISRATFALPEWLSRARALVREGGTILGMEGRDTHDLPPGAERYRYSLQGRSRAIVVWRSPN